MQGQRITGELADRYILKKEVARPDGNTSVSNNDFPLVGTKWRLVELRGQAVVSVKDGGEIFYIQLTNEGKVNAFAGCNRMFGGYELKEGLQIRFTAMASTRMACPDMKTEQILGEVLDSVDNYSLNGAILTLNKARMAPQARFEAEKKVK
jgi:heat shock protein HslJ